MTVNLQVGYPKSGNTWLLSIISYLYGERDFTKAPIPEMMIQRPETYNGWLRTHATPARLEEPSIKHNFSFVVYMVRHPLDVLCSAYRTQVEVDKHERAPLPEFLLRCLERKEDEYYLFTHSESWSTNVGAWIHVGYGERSIPTVYGEV